MKRRIEEDKGEEKVDTRESKSAKIAYSAADRIHASPLALCIATALAMSNRVSPSATPWSRLIRISSKNPLADPSIVQRLFHVMTRGYMFCPSTTGESTRLDSMRLKFPVTQHRRVMAAILCFQTRRADAPSKRHSHSQSQFRHIYQHLSADEWDRLLIHIDIDTGTNVAFDPEIKGLLFRTPSIFSHYCDTANAFSFWMMHLQCTHVASGIRFILVRFPELHDTVIYPNLRAVVAKFVDSGHKMGVTWTHVFQSWECLELIQIMWPAVNTHDITGHVGERLFKSIKPRTLEWVLQESPRPTRIQLLRALRYYIDYNSDLTDVRNVVIKYSGPRED